MGGADSQLKGTVEVAKGLKIKAKYTHSIKNKVFAGAHTASMKR